MKILPTLEGGLRIDAEDDGDWQLLSGITRDAVSCDEKLSLRLGSFITDIAVVSDWLEYIVPELEETFHGHLAHLAAAISAARFEAAGGPGPLWITPDDAFHWYSALNQARLALEERFGFGPQELIDPAELPSDMRSAFLRSHFYCTIQSLLLDHVMR